MNDNLLKKPRIITLFKINSLIFGLFLDTTPSSPLGFFIEHLIYGVSTKLRKSEVRINLTHERNEDVKSNKPTSSTLDNVLRGAYGR